MSWSAATLGEVVARSGGLIQTGPFGSQLHQSDYVTDGIPVIMPKDISDGRVDPTSVARVSEEIFDFRETAKRSLGQHWDARTPAERAEYIRLFTDLIQRSYASQVDHYGAEKLVYRGDTIDGDQAVVRTAFLLNDGGQMALDYKMHQTSDHWRVYDIIIEGVSLVSNYRAQFNKVIRSESYEALIARLKSTRVDSPAASPARRESSQ